LLVLDVERGQVVGGGLEAHHWLHALVRRELLSLRGRPDVHVDVVAHLPALERADLNRVRHELDPEAEPRPVKWELGPQGGVVDVADKDDARELSARCHHEQRALPPRVDVIRLPVQRRLVEAEGDGLDQLILERPRHAAKVDAHHECERHVDGLVGRRDVAQALDDKRHIRWDEQLLVRNVGEGHVGRLLLAPTRRDDAPRAEGRGKVA